MKTKGSYYLSLDDGIHKKHTYVYQKVIKITQNAVRLKSIAC